MTDWALVRDNGFVVPEGADLDALVDELVGMLGWPDPEARDALGFTTLATWVDERIVPDDRLAGLGDRMADQFGDARIRRAPSLRWCST